MKFRQACAYFQLLFLSFFTPHFLYAQTDSSAKALDFQTKGYVKYLHQSNFLPKDSLLTGQLIHQRLNVITFWKERWTGALEIRNRFLYGEIPRLTPRLKENYGKDAGWVDATFTWGSGSACQGITNFDRWWLKYRQKRWEMTLGRQRINWGVGLVWNPNDLFNTYSFIDFDYEERPGSDAIRFAYHPGDMSNMEVAWKLGKTQSENVIAFLHQFNRKGYDWQYFAGKYLTDYAVGGAWAGNLQKAGFKGEVACFFPEKSKEKSTFNGTMSLDYVFKNGAYANVSYLFQSQGAQQFNAAVFQTTFANGLTAKQLSPSQNTFFLQTSYPLTPLLSFAWSHLLFIDLQQYFSMPTLTYSLADRWEINFVGQSLWGKNDLKAFTHGGTSLFLRLRWSY